MKIFRTCQKVKGKAQNPKAFGFECQPKTIQLFCWLVENVEIFFCGIVNYSKAKKKWIFIFVSIHYILSFTAIYEPTTLFHVSSQFWSLYSIFFFIISNITVCTRKFNFNDSTIPFNIFHKKRNDSDKCVVI